MVSHVSRNGQANFRLHRQNPSDDVSDAYPRDYGWGTDREWYRMIVDGGDLIC